MEFDLKTKKTVFRLRMGSGHPLDIPPMTVPALFRRAVDTFPHLPALADKRGGEWTRCFFAKKNSFFVLTCFFTFCQVDLRAVLRGDEGGGEVFLFFKKILIKESEGCVCLPLKGFPGPWPGSLRGRGRAGAQLPRVVHVGHRLLHGGGAGGRAIQLEVTKKILLVLQRRSMSVLSR